MTNNDKFTVLMLEENDRVVTSSLTELTTSDLPDGAVTVAIDYSTLNYKDGMVLKGIGRLVRNYPHVPGVDFSGVVEASDSPDFAPGDRVVLNGWRVGESHWGGYGQKGILVQNFLSIVLSISRFVSESAAIPNFGGS